MTTLLPPPKRQKQYHGIPEPVPETPKPSPNVVVQFVNEHDGSAMAPAISVPANIARESLEVLVNRLSKKEDDDYVPFAFHVLLPAPSSIKEEEAGNKNAPTRIVVAKSIEADVLEHVSQTFTHEDVITVHCAPQSVFKVRPATRCSSTLSGHTSPILCASFSPTGSTLATGSGDTHVRLWDLATETPSHTLAGHNGWVLCVEWDARGRRLASGGHDGQVRLWDPRTGKPEGDAMRGHQKWVMGLAWEPVHLNPSSPRLASCSKDGTVRVWDAATRRVEYTLGGHTASVNVVKWGGGGLGQGFKCGVLYTASSDRTVRIWDADGGRLLHTLTAHAHWVTTLALNTDFVLRTGAYDHTAREPASDAEAQHRALERYEKVLSRTPELLISGSDDHTLFLWNPFPSSSPDSGSGNADAKMGKIKPLTRLTGHQRQVSHVAFSPDGRRAASAGWDSAVRLWDCSGSVSDAAEGAKGGGMGKFVATLRGHVGPVYRLAWSADSRMLVSASKDATVKIWDLRTYKIKSDLPGHTDEVYCVDFVADKVVSGGRDRVLKIWKN